MPRASRHHATAIESGEHLMQCLVYIDAGVVNHPSEWIYGACLKRQEKWSKAETKKVNQEGQTRLIFSGVTSICI